jgi:hypothetical protein
MKIMMTPHLVAAGSCDRMKTQKGTDNTKKSVSIVMVDVDVMKAAESIHCSTGMVLSQYEATGSLLQINAMHWEIVRAMLMVLITCQRQLV